MFLKKDSGLSLIGVLAAIYIVGMGLIAVLAVANMSISGSQLGKMRLIASGLAQEGVEIVRDIRRSNPDWIDWDWYGNNGAKTTSTPESFVVQYDEAVLKVSPTPGTFLKIDSDGFYQYDSGTDSDFSREIILSKEEPFGNLRVIVKVNWQLKGDDYNLIVEDHLWKWKY